MKRTLLFIALLALAFQACKKEDIPPVPDPNPEVLNLGNLTTASAYGLVLDESENPVAGALVSLGNKTALTDENGVFVLKNAQVRENLTQVKVLKGGYFTGSRSFRPKYESNPYVRIKLLERNTTGEFESSVGGAVQLADKVGIEFPADGIVNGSGQAYNGTVRVAVQYLDPTASDLDQIMPGNLLGFSEEDGESVLATFGMIAVDLYDPLGQKLQLAEGKPAKISISIPATLQSNAPERIPLWYFDEDLGIWMEEGEAVLENGQYVGEVSHFSFWNCDAPFPVIHMSGSVYWQDLGNPLGGVKITLTVQNSSIASCGYSDLTGVFEGDIPSGEVLVMDVFDLCGDLVYSTEIGPFSANVVLDPIILTAGVFGFTPVSISGSLVDCDENPVSNGYVKIGNNAWTTILPVDNSGAFSGLIQTCTGGDFEVVGVNLTDLVQSDIYTFPIAPEVVTGPIEACDIELAEYVEFDLDGEPYLLTENIYLGDSLPQQSFAISASGVNQSNWLSFAVEGAGEGIFPANQFFLGGNAGQGIFATDPENISVNVTEYSSVPGELVRGDFEGNFLDGQGNSHTVSGSFKAIRDF